LTSSIVFRQVSLRTFRNIRALDIEPHPAVNLVVGDNGQGKTSLLEALYLVATTKSFRADRAEEVIQDGEDAAVVRTEVVESELGREQRVVVTRAQRTALVDGKRPRSAVDYATRTPVVLFHPGDLGLVAGGAALRRTLLDRVGLFLDPASAMYRTRYLRAMQSRQRTLEDRGPGAPELEAFETLAAEHGSALGQVRALAAERLVQELHPVFSLMAPAGTEVRAAYRPGGAVSAAEFLRELGRRRGDDQRRGAATFGPQRDELELSIDGRSARRLASQGQQRLLALALKVAELGCLRAARGAHPILLLDDVSSELDPARAGAVYTLLDDTESQVFVTTTRPEVIQAGRAAVRGRLELLLERGALSRIR
jgi:DNA replication and repair protein RecF